MARRRRKILLAALLTVIAAAALIADSRYRLVTTEYDIYDAAIPKSFDSWRIVQLSDLHGAEFGRENIRLVKAVEEEEPDIIVITGDYITGSGDMETALGLTRRLVGIAPVYFVSGNHDWASGEITALREEMEALGVSWMDNTASVIELGEENIILCGVDDPNGYADFAEPDDFAASVRSEYPGSFILMLAHRNYWPEKYPDIDVNLILCGHGHGGVVRLPFAGGLLGSGGRLMPDYTDGLYEFGSSRMVVSRGLGTSYPRIPRFLNNPEIVTVVLKAG